MEYRGTTIEDFNLIWAAFFGGMARAWMVMACANKLYEDSAVESAKSAAHYANLVSSEYTTSRVFRIDKIRSDGTVEYVMVESEENN